MKAITTALVAVIICGITIGLVVLLMASQLSEKADIHTIVQSAEIDRHVIDMAQVLMGHPKLLVQEQDLPFPRYYRAVFDKEKLDEQMVSKQYYEEHSTLYRDSEISKEVGYPNCVYTITIDDLSSGEEWALIDKTQAVEIIKSEEGKSRYAESAETFKCLTADMPGSVSDWLFKKPFWSFFNNWSSECEKASKLKFKVSEKSFPVAIESDVGNLTIRMVEW